jgi:hypothetical protein
MGEEALLKKQRVTRRESTNFVWVSRNRISLELSHIQPFSLNFDSAHSVAADHPFNH